MFSCVSVAQNYYTVCFPAVKQKSKLIQNKNFCVNAYHKPLLKKKFMKATLGSRPRSRMPSYCHLTAVYSIT